MDITQNSSFHSNHTCIKKIVTFNCRGFAENSYQSLNFEESIVTAKSLEEECKFFCVSWLVLEGYFRNFTFFTSHVSAKTSVSVL